MVDLGTNTKECLETKISDMMYDLTWMTPTWMGSMSRSGGTTPGCVALVCFEAAAGAFFVAVESESKAPSLSFVTVFVTFRVAVFFTGDGGSLGFIAAVLVVRVVVAGAGSVGVAALERVALVVIVAVDGTGFGRREAIMYLLGFVDVCQSTRRVTGHVPFVPRNAPPLVAQASGTS